MNKEYNETITKTKVTYSLEINDRFYLIENGQSNYIVKRSGLRDFRSP